MASRVYTGIAGLPVCKSPQFELVKNYNRVLRKLEKIPSESRYYLETKKLIQDKIKMVESTSDRNEIEQKVNSGLCEELIEQAKSELKLIDVMNEYKPWEALVEKEPRDQWKWPLN